jgi:hypothetical protein
MDNMDFGAIGILAVILPAVVHAIPISIIIAGGVVAFRKGYMKSGSVIVASSALSLLLSFGQVVMMYNLGISMYTLWFGIGSQVLGLVAGGLLAGGVLGLAMSTPAVVGPGAP